MDENNLVATECLTPAVLHSDGKFMVLSEDGKISFLFYPAALYSKINEFFSPLDGLPENIGFYFDRKSRRIRIFQVDDTTFFKF